MKWTLSLEEIRKAVSPLGERGTYGGSIQGVSSLEEASASDLTFIVSKKGANSERETRASVVLADSDAKVRIGADCLLLLVDSPSLAMAQVCELVASRLWPRHPGGIDSAAVVADSANIAPSAYVGPFCSIGENAVVGANAQLLRSCHIEDDCEIGADCVLHSNVVIGMGSKLGARVRIHSNAVIGADGFGYEFRDGSHAKIPQVGFVTIGDDVEIGACTTIDRGRLGATEIGDGTKIDNQVQVAHNTRIGKHCILCAQVGIAGSTVIEDYVVFGGRAGASDHLTIGKGAQIAGCSAAFSDVEAGSKVGGVPSISLGAYQRITVLSRKLPDVFRRLKNLEEHILDKK